MASNITNYVSFTPDECGAFTGFTAPEGVSYVPFSFGLQKSTINTVSDFCYNQFGAVSNIDCPDWDPSCNCLISQYRPNKPIFTDKEILEMKVATNECTLIQEVLPNKDGEIDENKPSDWWGIDFSNKKCPYNCFYYESDKPTVAKKKENVLKTPFFGPTGDLGGKYPYSLGLSGISSQGILQQDTDSSRDDMLQLPLGDGVQENYQSWSQKITGPLFPYYLEYSKTNATFWNTPEKTPLIRAALMALYRFQQIKITVNGDYGVKIGSLINIRMPIKDELHTSRSTSFLTDKRFAGTWMVYRIERTIMASKHTMALYLMRDGFNTDKYSEPSLNKYGNPTYKTKQSDESGETE